MDISDALPADFKAKKLSLFALYWILLFVSITDIALKQ